jgi:tRNA threonylcarbamoyladenosine biosynthesis protein TsaB
MCSAAPLLLALESATRSASVALLRGEQLLLLRSAGPERDLAEVLLPLVDRVLSEAECSLEAVGGFALTIGPGSFTSLRIGLATVKGLAFGTGRPVAPVSTLEAMALGPALAADRELAVVPMLDARKGEVYAAAYTRRGEGLACLVEEGVYSPAELAQALEGPCLLVGEGAALLGEQLIALCGPEVELGSGASEPLAKAVGRVGARSLASGAGVDAADLVPRYLRRAQAEVVRTGVRFEGPG